MGAILVLGFLIGLRHALEADHVAAVASLATRSSRLSDTLRVGVIWGLGHTLALFFFGTLVIVLRVGVPLELADLLEFAVGIMLLVLGLDVLRRLRRDRIHIHLHRHEGGERHLHAHSHLEDPAHSHHDMPHVHRHPQVDWSAFPVRALFVGLMHGMAGSAALILLTLETIESPWVGMLYIALFGVGSMCGMALLSIVIALPLRHTDRGLTWFHFVLQAVVGLGTTALGIFMILSHFPLD